MAVKESDIETFDMGSVHIGIGHDDDFVVAQFIQIELLPYSGTDSHNQTFEFIRFDDLVYPGSFSIEDFAEERENRLEFAVTAVFGRPSRRISLNYKQLG